MLRALHPISQNPPALVSDLIISAERSWNRDALRDHLQAPDIQAILNIPLGSVNAEDIWAWHYERSGQFSVRSAYRMLMESKKRREDWLSGRAENSRVDDNKHCWKSLWKINAPGKIKKIAWRLAQNTIPTDALRHHRHMTESSVCPVCNGAEDTWKHALMECTVAKCVWSLIDEDRVEHLIACRMTDAKLWLNEMQVSMDENSFVKTLSDPLVHMVGTEKANS